MLNKLDASESVTAGRLLDAWGQGVETTLPRNIDPWGYNAKWGYYYDRETALYLCQHRMYDASAGRWLNRDPIGLAGGMNLYGYCAGGPVGAADPRGLAKAGYPGQIGKILGSDDPCSGLASLIEETTKDLEKRRNDMLNDPWDLFNNPQPPVRLGGRGDYWTHLAEFYKKKRFLDALYMAWGLADCDDNDPSYRKSKGWSGAYGAAPVMPRLESPTNWYHPAYQSCEPIADSSGHPIPWGSGNPGLPWQRVPSFPVPAPTMPLAPPSPIVIPLSMPRIAA